VILPKTLQSIFCAVMILASHQVHGRSEEDAQFYSVADLDVSTFRPEVVGPNTWRAEPRDWPATFFEEKTQCTANLVGPRALLLAAHCVKNRSVQLKFPNRKLVSGHCVIPNDYRDHSSNDYALCKLDEPGVKVLLYETVQLNPSDLKNDGKMLLAGFGCRNAKEAAGRKDREDKYWLGYSVITKLPNSQQLAADKNWIETSGDAGLSVMDSGGCAFRVDGEGRDVTSRVCVAIASGNDTGGCGSEVGTSYLSSLGTPEGAEFVTNWEKNEEKGAAICGVTPGMQNCR